jgi:hypothetical protein
VNESVAAAAVSAVCTTDPSKISMATAMSEESSASETASAVSDGSNGVSSSIFPLFSFSWSEISVSGVIQEDDAST